MPVLAILLHNKDPVLAMVPARLHHFLQSECPCSVSQHLGAILMLWVLSYINTLKSQGISGIDQSLDQVSVNRESMMKWEI